MIFLLYFYFGYIEVEVVYCQLFIYGFVLGC